MCNLFDASVLTLTYIVRVLQEANLQNFRKPIDKLHLRCYNNLAKQNNVRGAFFAEMARSAKPFNLIRIMPSEGDMGDLFPKNYRSDAILSGNFF